MKGSIFHKKQTSTCWIVCLVLLGVYLFAALRPGVWLRDAFLYRQADGSFSGKDAYAAYTLQLSGTESEAEAVFTLDGETRHYRIEAKDSAEVKLYQDGALIFAGSALGDPGDAILWREDDGDLADEVKVIVNGEYQNMGCGKCKLADGDVVRWDYTCDLGLDLDADMPGAQEWMDTHE
mgnify:CR=1 FL=1